MRNYRDELELIANDIIVQSVVANGDDAKPNYSNHDFMNATVIFVAALMDKMYDNQDLDDMGAEDRLKMTVSCGLALKKLIHTYTGLDISRLEDFV